MTLKTTLAFLDAVDKIVICVEDGEPYILATANGIDGLDKDKIKEYLGHDVHFTKTIKNGSKSELFIYVY